LALKGAGVSAVIARSFAGIFFRNAINIGLPFLEMQDTGDIRDGDTMEIDLAGGVIKNSTSGKTYKTQAFPQFLQEIVEKGGLINYVKSKGQRKNA
jgi:3-isopropylmalate/(R)-2-methylmalate dehydratase small subunit